MPGIESLRPYPKESELAKRLNSIIYEYSGELSIVSVVGVLDMLKFELINDSFEGEE